MDTTAIDRPRGRDMLHVPRTKGALSGLLIMAAGVWGALIPFVGPYFDFGFTTDAWSWTANRFWLSVLPGLVAIVAGWVLLVSRNRANAAVGAVLASAAGLWFIVGPPLSQIWNPGALGVPLGGEVRQTLTMISFFFGLGALILFLGASALGRLSVVGVRDVAAARNRRLGVTEPGRHARGHRRHPEAAPAGHTAEPAGRPWAGTAAAAGGTAASGGRPTGQEYAGQPHPSSGYPGPEYPGDVYPDLERHQGREYAGQAPSGPERPGEPHPGQQYGGQQYGGQQYGGQQYGGQPYAGQPYAGQGYAGYGYPTGEPAGQGYQDQGHTGPGAVEGRDYARSSPAPDEYAGRAAAAPAEGGRSEQAWAAQKWPDAHAHEADAGRPIPPALDEASVYPDEPYPGGPGRAPHNGHAGRFASTARPATPDRAPAPDRAPTPDRPAPGSGYMSANQGAGGRPAPEHGFGPDDAERGRLDQEQVDRERAERGHGTGPEEATPIGAGARPHRHHWWERPH